METELRLNAKRYKNDSENYKKLKQKIIKLMATEELISELKKRKIIHMNWETLKYDFNGMEGSE